LSRWIESEFDEEGEQVRECGGEERGVILCRLSGSSHSKHLSTFWSAGDRAGMRAMRRISSGANYPERGSASLSVKRHTIKPPILEHQPRVLVALKMHQGLYALQKNLTTAFVCTNSEMAHSHVA